MYAVALVLSAGFGVLTAVQPVLGIALFIAIILDRGQVYGRSFFRLGFFIPYAVPSVIAALVWGYLYGPTFGPFAQLARAMNVPPLAAANPSVE